MQELEERLKSYRYLFGGWLPGKEIGHGSFGRVYILQRADTFGIAMYSALKAIPILPTGAVTASRESLWSYVKDYYLPEVELMNRLRGEPHVVRLEDYAIYEIHADDGKRIGCDLLIRMELLDTLENQLRENTVSLDSPALARRVATDIAQALTACHKQNILHRDINPGNIFCDPLGSYKLGDFGIAKRLEGTMDAHTRIGTEMYVAPEVRDSASTSYNELADIYSLGLVMYQLLNGGLLPFFEKNMNREQRRQAMNRRFSGEALPMPRTTDRRLAAIARKAAAFDPEQRYQTAEELLHAIQDVELEERTEQLRTARFPVPALPKQPMETESACSLLDILWNSVGLSVVDTMEVRHMRRLLAGGTAQTTASDQPEAPGSKGELTREKANKLPVFSPHLSFLSVNRLNLTGWDSIADRAFYQRGDLCEVTIQVRTIGKQVFAQCKGLERVTLTGTEEIDNGAFEGCAKLLACELPDTLQRLGESTFATCSALQTVTIPSNLHVLERRTFSSCAHLSRIAFPPRLTTIGAEAFSHSGLVECNLPESVNQMDKRVFSGCHALNTVTLPTYLSDIPDGCFVNCSRLREIALPKCLQTVGDHAFQGCQALTRVVLPEGTRRIGTGAFMGCDKLTEIVVPGTVESFGTEAFGHVGGLFKGALALGRFTVVTPKDSPAWHYCKQNSIKVRER